MAWQLGEARQRVENGRAALEVRLRELADLMGVGGERRIVLGESPLLEVEPPEEGAAVEVAWRERPEIRQAEEDVGAARRGVKVARRGLLPEVSAVAEKAWWGEGDSWSDAMGGGDGEPRAGRSRPHGGRQKSEKNGGNYRKIAAEEGVKKGAGRGGGGRRDGRGQNS